MLPTVNAQNSTNTQGVVATPDSLDAMRHRLAAEHHALSPRLQDVGTYVAAHPQSIAVDTLAQIAERAGSHPSTLVRFARYFGFTGFSELQQLYKQHVHDHFAAVDYGTRIRNRQPGHNDSAVTPAGLLNVMCCWRLPSAPMPMRCRTSSRLPIVTVPALSCSPTSWLPRVQTRPMSSLVCRMPRYARFVH